MTVNWGTRIAVLYIAFVVMIVTLVAATFRSKPVLVTDDYYLRETKFQEQLDAERAAAALETKPQVHTNGDSIRLELPLQFRDTHVLGTITCYFPSNAQADKIISFATESAEFAFDAPETKEPYQLRIDWVGKGVHYYYQIP